MKLNLYDKDLNRIAIIGEVYKSCLWKEGYASVEPFTLELPSNDEYRKKVKTDCYIGRTDRDTLMVIKDVDFQKDSIVISGKQATRILDDVAFIGTIDAGQRIDTAIKSAYNKSDKYHNLTVANFTLGETYPHQISHKSMLELAQAFCQETSSGLKVYKEDKKLLFSLYRPDAKENLVFGEKFGNMTLQGLKISNEAEKNYAIVLGQDEGADRVRVDVDLSLGGQKKQLIIDARDLQKEDGETDDAYNSRLYARGFEALADTISVMDCSILPVATDFGVKYDLGDILQIHLTELGLTLIARVVRFSEKSQNNMTEKSVEIGDIMLRKGRR